MESKEKEGRDEELYIVYLRLSSVVLYIAEGVRTKLLPGGFFTHNVRGINSSAARVRCIESEQKSHHVYSERDGRGRAVSHVWI